ncbi:MAG: GNAT family N-acetyltransferase [Acidobacteriota bacterium]|nr:GNAT family N-acetyltransferase [Acidobacteriota bacterium]
MKLPTNETFKFPIIETERLILRMFEADDFDAAYLLFSDTDVQKYLSPANRRTPEQMRVTLEKLATRWLERGFGIWCVCDKNSGGVIGYSGFQYFEKSSEVEILFGYLKEFWGNGYATEAARACLR